MSQNGEDVEGIHLHPRMGITVTDRLLSSGELMATIFSETSFRVKPREDESLVKVSMGT